MTEKAKTVLSTPFVRDYQFDNVMLMILVFVLTAFATTSICIKGMESHARGLVDQGPSEDQVACDRLGGVVFKDQCLGRKR